MQKTTRNQAALIRSLYTRHGRKKHGLCVCDGMRACREFLALRPELMRMAVCMEGFDTSQFPGTEFITAPESEFRSISSNIEAQGVLIAAEIPDTRPEYFPKPADPFITVLDCVADPGNLGTIIRTMRAAGLKELWCTRGTADPFNEKSIRAALAAQFALNIRMFEDAAELAAALRKHGYGRIFIADPRGGKSFFDEEELYEKSAIVFGNEARGASPVSGAMPVSIPMPGGAESLNVAQAATLVIYEWVRRGSLK